MYQTVLKETYEGKYSITGDTLSVILTSYISKQNRLGLKGKSQIPEKLPIAINKSVNYIISEKRIDALNSVFPSLKLSQYSIYLDLVAKFEDWKDKKDPTSAELGHSK
ncbi:MULTISPECIES: hypothetical protein [unclassified Paraflavitalea]|uniref:hypothetical protein n=1 Tax=unclassified Paraflavitalea TaxID=2798305 RepID=UPI003D3288AE